MAIYQVFGKLLQIPSSTLSGKTVKRGTGSQNWAAPLRLVSGTRQISKHTVITTSPDGLFLSSLSLLLRLRGGRDGFGSPFHSATTKPGQKKTNNFDACRDMSGRRLRYVNAKKKLKEWKVEAEEPKLETLAEDFPKKKAKEVKNSSAAHLEKYREEVEESERQSFASYRNPNAKSYLRLDLLLSA